MGSIPPVSRGNFSYAVDSFYVESSNFEVYRRATVDQVRALFQPGPQAQKEDQTGHWYEAQLIHYGLPPSKNKAVAKMRLLDALNAGKLVVPKEIAKIEAELKKEWKKKEKESSRCAQAAGCICIGGHAERKKAEKRCCR